MLELTPTTVTFDPFTKPAKQNFFYKIYHDGGHYIATRVNKKRKGKTTYGNTVKDIDILFDSLYFNAIKQSYKRAETVEYIKQGIAELFPEKENLDEYISEKIKRKYLNLHKRKKRFKRKANLNKWNYFVTITYDDEKHSAESFRKKLRKCLCNLKSRRNWRYMGVFEYAPITGRLHFHALMYIPQGEMIGSVTEKKDYSTNNGQMQTTFINSFFNDSFGRNDFKEINDNELRTGQTLNYILKYIAKTGEKIVYSRGIASEIVMQLSETEIVAEMVDFVLKFILFDDTVDWETDVMKWRYTKQMTIYNLLCNP